MTPSALRIRILSLLHQKGGIAIVHLRGKSFIGRGCYGRVYRFSKRRIVKVYTGAESTQLELALDEVLGSKRIKNALPVLRLAKVYQRGRESAYGLVKRYLPYDAQWGNEYGKISPAEICKRSSWDRKWQDIRYDTSGGGYLIDTQTRKVLKIRLGSVNCG